MEKKSKSFEESLANLETIVKELEAGNVELDKAIEKYTEAMKLAKYCQDKITNATEQVNKILNENNELEEFKAE
jgi:exodeoxyribonuclease VII small subunit